MHWLENILKWCARRLGNPRIRVYAQLDQEIPLTFSKPIIVPVQGQFTIAFEEDVDVEGLVPVKIAVPIDTVVETDVLKFGRIRIPIRATIPLEFSVPIRTRVKVKIQALNIGIDQPLPITLPTLLVPLATSLGTSVTILPEKTD